MRAIDWVIVASASLTGARSARKKFKTCMSNCTNSTAPAAIVALRGLPVAVSPRLRVSASLFIQSAIVTHSLLATGSSASTIRSSEVRRINQRNSI